MGGGTTGLQQNAAKVGQFFFDPIKGGVEFGVWLGEIGEGVELLHRGNDDSDEEVQDGERRNHNKRDEEGPSPRVNFHDGADDAHGPAFKGHDLEKGKEAFANRAKPCGEVGTEEVGGQDGGGEKKDGHDRHHSGKTWDGMEKGCDDLAELWNNGKEPEDAENAEGAKNSPGASGRNQGNANHEKVKDVPAITPEDPTEADEFDDQLHDEDGETEFIQRFQCGAILGHDVGIRFKTEDGGVEEDHRDNERLDATGFDPVTEMFSPWGGLLGIEHTEQILFG